MSTSRETLHKRIKASRGEMDCDLVIRNVRWLDVFSYQWVEGDLAIFDGVIVGTDSGYRAHKIIDAKGKFCVPGFLDAHVHLESSMMLPSSFEDAVLKKGTTTAICDPHELANVLGVSGIEYFLKESEKRKLDLKVMISSCVPATHLETNGGGLLSAKDLAPLKKYKNALGLAEMMNVPGVLFGSDDVLEKIEEFQSMPMDGHCPLLRGKDLSAYATAGISSCHESSEYEEAKEKLQKGIKVWIREGSVAKDVEALTPLLDAHTAQHLGFCTDDRNPLDIAEEGHIDYLVRRVIQKGVDPKAAYLASSYSVARHYGLDRGPNRVGAIAPGYLADLILLSDEKSVSIDQVLKNGISVNELEIASSDQMATAMKSVKAHVPEEAELRGPEGRVHVIGVEHGKIITTRSIKNHNEPGVSKLTVVERYGNGNKPSNGYVSGFGSLQGAIASSVGHDSHNLIAVGSSEKDMRVALSCLIDQGGGFCVVKNGSVVSTLPLPFGGLMSTLSPEELKTKISDLKQASKSIGCILPEPFLQLAFLSLPVIPSLKLTDLGLVDVDQFKIISVSA